VKIAVTGASGFIGSYILSELDSRNVEIIAISRTIKHNSSSDLKNVQWVNLDILNPPKNCFKAIGEPDNLINLAWGGLPNYRSNHHIDKELPSQYHFLSNLINEGLKSLISVGTCFEYGMQSGALAANLKTNPDNPYGKAKDTLHNQLRELSKIYPVKLTWARLFYIYGIGQAESSLYSALRSSVINGDKIFKMSGGKQIRDFMPVEKVATEIVDLVFNEEAKDVVNICSGMPVSVQKFVEQLLKENNWNIELALGEYPYPNYEPHAFWGVK